MHLTISTPICDFIQHYNASGISRFHMPGHKGAAAMPELSARADITEIQGADCLYEASGIIRESEENAARLFGTGATFYSTEGSSQCIRAMLALVSSPGSVILAARNVHRSFLTAAALLDLDVQWLYPGSGTSGSICSCPVTAEQLRCTLSAMHPLPAAVYITSPDYLGYLQNIRELAEAAHSFGVPLLVDNAHGAYLHFLKQPVHPMDLCADMCCDSAHKTLPALTGCAYLHLSREAAAVYAAGAKKALSLFGSTSPSWLLLQSLDDTNRILNEDFRERLETCVSNALELKSAFLPGSAARQEPLKITIPAISPAQKGTQLANQLRQCSIECEYADPDYVVLMLSPYNTETDMERLTKALKQMGLPAASCEPSFHMGRPLAKALSIREAALAPSLRIPAEEAVGRICADLTLSCPPGIPAVICGEIISCEAVRLLQHYGITTIEVVSR